MSPGLLTGPSVHLTWRELACRDGTPYPREFIRDRRINKLAKIFEIIRGFYDKPIVVLSAYRTPSHNRSIKGAPNSQHLHGRALDLRPPKGVSLDRFYNDIKAIAYEVGIRGIGKYTTFVHIDIRETNKLVSWSGSGIKDG